MSAVFQWDLMKDRDEIWTHVTGYTALDLSNLNIDKPSLPLLDFIERNRNTITKLNLCNCVLYDVDFHVIFGYLAECLTEMWICDVEVISTQYYNQIRKYKLPKLTALSIQFSSYCFSFKYITSFLEMENLVDLEYFDYRSDQCHSSNAVVQFIATRKHLEKVTLECSSAVLSKLANSKHVGFKAKEFNIEFRSNADSSESSTVLVDDLLEFFRFHSESLRKLTLAKLVFDTPQISLLMMFDRLEHLVVCDCSFIPNPEFDVMNYSIKALEFRDMQGTADPQIDKGLFNILKSCRGVEKLTLINTAKTKAMAYASRTFCKRLTTLLDNEVCHEMK